MIFAALALSLGLDDQLLFLIFGLPALFLGRSSYRHFKRRHGGSFSDDDLDHKEPVLFLRPFEQDSGWDGAVAFNVYRPSTWRKFPLSPTNMTALYLELTGRLSLEQVLAHVVRKTGPLVAIGEPGSPPILGARNLYVGDDNWQQQVRDLAARSRLVVLTAGTSEGVLWEVEAMVDTVPPSRFILNVPGSSRSRRREAYAAFHLLATQLFPAGLPETIDGARFLLFGDGWAPILDWDRRNERNSPAWVANRLKALLV